MMLVCVRAFALSVVLVLISGGAAAAALPPGWKLCSNPPHGYAIAYPAGWYTAQLRPSERCTAFDPQPFRVVPGSERPLTRLAVSLESAPAARVAAWFGDRRYYRGHSTPLRVNGRRGYRFEVVATGQGLFSRGTRFYGYVLDQNRHALVVQTGVPAGYSGYVSFKHEIDQAVASLRFFLAHQTTHKTGRQTVRVYFANSRLQRDPNSCNELFARPRSIPPSNSPAQTLSTALRSLLRGPNQKERAMGYTSWFSTRTAASLRDVRVLTNAIVRIDFHANLARLIHNAGSSCGSASLLAALDTTTRSLMPHARPLYSLNGDCRAFSNWLQRLPPHTCPGARISPTSTARLSRSTFGLLPARLLARSVW